MQQPSSYQRFYGYPAPPLNSWRPGMPVANRGPPYPPYQAAYASTHSDAVRSWTAYDPGATVASKRQGNGGHQGGQGQRVSQLRGQDSWRGAQNNMGFAPIGNQNNRNNRNQKSSLPRSAQPSPPAKRSRQSNSRHSHTGPWYDDQYMVKTYPELTNDIHKGIQKIMADPKNFFWGQSQYTPTVYAKEVPGKGYRATVIIKSVNGEFEAIGDGPTKKAAEKTACRHVIYKAHKEGKLTQLMTGDPASQYTKEQLSAESDAIIDVFDYGARFDTIPTVKFQRHPTFKTMFEVVIEMPLHNIKVSGRGKTLKNAEIVAAIEFKKAAEEYHAKNSEGDLVLKDPNALNSTNAKKFFEYYKTMNKSAFIDVVTSRPEGDKRVVGSCSQAQITINGEGLGEPVMMQTKAAAQSLAYLTGAVALKAKHPEIFPGFVEALKAGAGEILKPIPPIWLNPRPNTLLAMADTVKGFRRAGLKPIEIEEEEAQYRQQRGPPRHRLPEAAKAMKSKQLKKDYDDYWANPEIAELRQKRVDLPMNKYANKVIDLVENNSTSIIVGATGSGKTTQVPQILLDEYIKRGDGANCNILCTQPRRIAATSVATRVAVERHEPLRKTVGYQVRFDSQLPQSGGSITYCTTGILLQQLRHSDDEALEGITHLVIDEVHERDILIDFLLILLKRVIRARREAGKPEIKVVLMSATMDTEMFANYFAEIGEDGKVESTPSLSVPGRTFPVKEFYLDDILGMLKSNYNQNDLAMVYRDRDTLGYLESEERFPKAYEQMMAQRREERGEEPLAVPIEEGTEDATIDWKAEVVYDSNGEVALSSEKDDSVVPTNLIAATVAHIVKSSNDGAVLVFVPGLAEIEQVEQALMQRPLGVDFSDTSKYKVCMLHSTIPTDKDLFDTLPDGCRKIILSTNIAETSVTIPDVQYVVDSGKLREKQYDQGRRITRLLCTWISKSNSKQRAGRAGRVQNGNYYALFTKTRWQSMRATGLPEMLRSDLQEICLDIKAQGFTDPIADFLSEAIEPPKTSAVDASLTHLRNIGALTHDESLTPLGKILSALPVEPALGKMILLSVMFRCLDPMLILGAGAGGRDIFLGIPDRKKEIMAARRRFAYDTDSDQIAMINAFREWRDVRDKQGMNAAFNFCDRNFLHRGALKTLDQTAKQIEDILVEHGLFPRPPFRNRDGGEYGNAMLNENADSVGLIKALAIAGQIPNVALNIGGRGFRTSQENFTMIHPTSVNYSSRSMEVPFGTMLTYGTKARSNDGNAVYIRNTTITTQLSAFLFGGELQKSAERIIIGKWLPFSAPMQTARVLIDFRRALDLLLENAFNDLHTRDRKAKAFFAEDPTRALFARGLVEVLNLDHPATPSMPSAVRRERNQAQNESSADSFLRLLSEKPSYNTSQRSSANASPSPYSSRNGDRDEVLNRILGPKDNAVCSDADLERERQWRGQQRDMIMRNKAAMTVERQVPQWMGGNSKGGWREDKPRGTQEFLKTGVSRR